MINIFPNPCLPRHFARGVHVFQASSRRLPGKHDGFDYVHDVLPSAPSVVQWALQELMPFRCPLRYSTTSQVFHFESGVAV